MFLLWLIPTAATYFLVLFTYAGNYFHGGTPAEAIFLDTCMVVSVAALLELWRSKGNRALFVGAAIVSAPVVVALGFRLWFAAQYIFIAFAVD